MKSTTERVEKTNKVEESLNKSDDFFKEFNKESSKNIPPAQNPLKDSDSFGGFGAQKKEKKEDDDDDFFTKK